MKYFIWTCDRHLNKATKALTNLFDISATLLKSRVEYGFVKIFDSIDVTENVMLLAVHQWRQLFLVINANVILDSFVQRLNVGHFISEQLLDDMRNLTGSKKKKRKLFCCI